MARPPANPRYSLPPPRRFWSLYGEVLRQDVLAAALEAVAANGGAPGVDGERLETITSTAQSREAWLEALRGELQAKTYRPAPVRRVWIAKGSGGGERPLGIPTEEAEGDSGSR